MDERRMTGAEGRKTTNNRAGTTGNGNIREIRSSGDTVRRRTAGSAGDTVRHRTTEGSENVRRRRPSEGAANGSTPRRRMQEGMESGSTPRRKVQEGAESGSASRRRVQEGMESGSTPRRRVQEGAESGSMPRRRVQEGAESGSTPRRRVQEGAESGSTPRHRVQEGAESGSASRRRMSEDMEFGGPARYKASESSRSMSRTDAAMSQRNGRNGKRGRKKKGVNPILLILIMIVLIAAIAAGTLVWIKYGPTKDKYDLNKYFGIESQDQIGMTINNEVTGAQAMRIDGEIYVSYEIVRDYLNQRFYWDPNENILLYTLPREMVRVDVGSKEYTISKKTESEDYVILKTDGSTAYIALDFVQKYTNLEYEVYENPSPARVMIVSEFGETQTAIVKRDTQVRLRGGVKSPVLTEVKKDDKVTVIEEIGDWKKVRTKDGIVGYVGKTKLRKQKTETISREFEEEEFTSIHKDETINLAWHQVTSQAANASVLETIAKTKGLTTISPTWFSVADNSGRLNSIANSEYVNYAHQAGIEVWALVDNFNPNVDQMELLSHTSSRENLENNLIAQALQSGIDGINVDFEQIPAEVGEHYIQFIRELSVKCRINDLVLSVDNYVPKGFNQHYHRKEQGVVADYVIIMGYDEHYSGSYEAGSVSSYNYVKEGIEETLKDVPAEKVISALPFYTRLWKEVPKSEEELAEQKGSEAGNYEMKVTSEALGMTEAAKRVKRAGAEITWNDEVKQDYAQWDGADGATYKIWLENDASLEAKLKLMKENQLAGTAAWKLGFETKSTWELILKYVN